MPKTAPPFDFTLARQVKADTLEPHQQKTERNFKTSTDYYVQHMLKHPYLSEFHCLAELLKAGMNEGTPSIKRYVPQSHKLWIRNKRYKPDGYLEYENGPREVYELKPRGEMADQDRIPLEEFFKQHGLKFTVISNESVYEHQIEAENWLEIVRILHISRYLTTTEAEYTVLETLQRTEGCTLGEFIDTGDRERTYPLEIALFRLLQRGLITAELDEKPLDLDTRFASCPT